MGCDHGHFKVAGRRSLADTTPILELDELVPLQFRAYKEPLGAGYLRLGNYSTTLIELAVEPYSQVLHGLTITSIALLSPWPSFSVSAIQEGLPVLATDFEEWQVLDLEEDFIASAHQDEIVVSWDDLGPCEAYAFDRVRFLVRDGVLAGVWFVGLTEGESRRFRSHARPAEALPTTAAWPPPYSS